LTDVTTIAIDTPDGPIDALLSVPDGQGPWPGVVVVHDGIGYGPDKEATSARIAAAGFVYRGRLQPRVRVLQPAPRGVGVGAGTVQLVDATASYTRRVSATPP
jgi:hypothetical protein